MRYIWAKQSHCYHDTNVAVEKCNVDDIKDREEGDTPPPFVKHTRMRKLCKLCERHAQEIQMQRSA